MSQFTFLQREWGTIFEAAAKAEPACSRPLPGQAVGRPCLRGATLPQWRVVYLH